MVEPIQSFKELRVYQMACDLDYQVFLETKPWPPEEKYSLVDQIRRSSRAIGRKLGKIMGSSPEVCLEGSLRRVAMDRAEALSRTPAHPHLLGSGFLAGFPNWPLAVDG